MEIDYINGPKTDTIFGISRYQNEMHKRMKDIDFNVIEYESLTKTLERKYKSLFPDKTSYSFNTSPNKKSLKYKMVNSLVNTVKDISDNIDRNRYSNLVKNKVKPGNVKHITYQDLGYLLNSIKLERSIVTCHDLIPWAFENNRSSYWKNNIKGLKKADRIITISQFSKNEIIKYLKYPEDKIHIVPDGVDRSFYFKNPNKNVLSKLNLSNDKKIVLYVGSEEPRQNVDKLIKAFAKLKKKEPEVKLLKIGTPNLYGMREKLLKLINDLNLQGDVIFTGFIPEEDLPKWYNAADLLVYPCAYAGFGLPPLEAMACGTPVITSNTTSLPEVVGDAGIMVNPNNINELADKMHEVLTNNGLREDMTKKGLKRAKMFNWNESAKKTMKIYEDLYYGD